MSKTRHIQARMSQRSIKQGVVDLALTFGEPAGDKHVLNRKALKALQAELARLKKLSEDAMKHGGVVVVEDGGELITTYGLDSYRRVH